MGHQKEQDGTEAKGMTLDQLIERRKCWDDDIAAEQQRRHPDTLRIQRLKKLKLIYKEQILKLDPYFFSARSAIPLQLVA